MQDFRKIKVWQKSHELVLEIYKATLAYPKEELYGLTAQIRRSCASIPTNIAEGRGRGGDLEFKRFLQIALGSAFETEYQLLLAHDLGYISNIDYEKLLNNLIEVKRMLVSFIQRIKAEG